MSRDAILEGLWTEQDHAYKLMLEYDSMPHHYGAAVLFQAEAYIVAAIGKSPGITITEIAQQQKKTTSACSQIVKKLINKGLVKQTRNADNRRTFNLSLTELGMQLHHDHIEFNKLCQKRTFDMLKDFSDEELTIHTRVQSALNLAYIDDLEKSREKYG